MNLVERAKNILLTPKTEWLKIEQENDTHSTVLTKYLLILAAIPALFYFLGYGVIGYSILGVRIVGISMGIRYALIQYISCVGGAYLTAWVFDLLAEKFKAQKNFDKKFQLVAYCYTAMCVGGVFYIHYSLHLLASLASLYGLYLLWLGLKPMTGVSDENKTTYFIVSLLCMVAVSVVLGIILAAVFVSSAWLNI